MYCALLSILSCYKLLVCSSTEISVKVEHNHIIVDIKRVACIKIQDARNQSVSLIL